MLQEKESQRVEPSGPQISEGPHLLGRGYKRKGRAERLWKPIKLNLTERYKYIYTNIGLRILYFFTIWLIMPAIYLVLKVRWHFKVTGRANLKPVRGRPAVAVSNHIHDADALMITEPFWPDTPYIIARKHNLEVFLVGIFNRIMRAVPLPEDLENFRHMSREIDEVLTETKHKVHVFPEGEIAPYDRELRKFSKGAFHFAVRDRVPVVPMVFVTPGPDRLTLMIGEVIEPENIPGFGQLSRPKQIRELERYTQKAMRKMMDDFYQGTA